MTAKQRTSEMTETESQIVATYGDLLITINSFAKMVNELASHAYIEKVDTAKNEFTLGGASMAAEAFRDVFSRPVTSEGSSSICYIGAVQITHPDFVKQIENLNQKKESLAAIHASYLKAGGRSEFIASMVHNWIDARNSSTRSPADRLPLGMPFIKSVTRKVRTITNEIDVLAFYPRRYSRVERITLDTIFKRMELLNENAYQAALINLKSISSEDKLRFVYDSKAVGYRARFKTGGSWSSVSVALPIILTGQNWPDVQTLDQVKGNRSARSDTGDYRAVVESLGVYEKLR